MIRNHKDAQNLEAQPFESENNSYEILGGLFSRTWQMGLKFQTQVIRYGGKHFWLLSLLAGLESHFFNMEDLSSPKC